jgi:uncharacterized membrane protein YphA (DoxX/SURF4 family)
MKLILEERKDRLDRFKTVLLRVAAALIFFSVGAQKFAAHSQWTVIFEQIGFGQWFRYFTGVVQITGAALVLIPRTFGFGVILFAGTMAGAAACWVFLLGNPANAVFPRRLADWAAGSRRGRVAAVARPAMRCSGEFPVC